MMSLAPIEVNMGNESLSKLGSGLRIELSLLMEGLTLTTTIGLHQLARSMINQVKLSLPDPE